MPSSPSVNISSNISALFQHPDVRRFVPPILLAICIQEGSPRVRYLAAATWALLTLRSYLWPSRTTVEPPPVKESAPEETMLVDTRSPSIEEIAEITPRPSISNLPCNPPLERHVGITTATTIPTTTSPSPSPAKLARDMAAKEEAEQAAKKVAEIKKRMEDETSAAVAARKEYQRRGGVTSNK